MWLVSASWFGTVAVVALRGAMPIPPRVSMLLPWVASLALVNLLSVNAWQSATLVADMPITAAASLVLSPIEAGIVAFLGTCDVKEFQRTLPPTKAIFNRSQLGLGVAAASSVVHLLTSRPTSSIAVIAFALLSVCVQLVVNYTLVASAISLGRHFPFKEVVLNLRVGTSHDFLLTHLTWAILGGILGVLYHDIHPWALLVFLLPALLGRQTLLRSQMFLEAWHAYKTGESVLKQLTRRMSEEREDERRLIAAELHDEILPPLFQVSLMARVLKEDLRTGRLVELDDDIPELLSAVDVASSAIRDMIGDLRKSSLSSGGLPRGLELLARQAREVSAAQIDTSIEQVEVDPECELVLYQIAKEAITNAVTHSQATRISISLAADEDAVLLRVCDNGRGFDSTRGKHKHFGLQIMKERAQSLGASLYIDTAPREGCSISVVLPRRTHK